MSATVHHISASRGFVSCAESSSEALESLRCQLRAELAEQNRLQDVATTCRALAAEQEQTLNSQHFLDGAIVAQASADGQSVRINELRSQEQQLLLAINSEVAA